VRLVDSLGNQALTAIVRQVVETPLFYHSVMWFDEPQLGRSVAQHETLLTAFEAGDEAAAETCWFGHIQEGKFTLLSNLERHSRQYYGAPEAEPLGTPR
jgi:DNA-binding GntR family transcriptional regulator